MNKKMNFVKKSLLTIASKLMNTNLAIENNSQQEEASTSNVKQQKSSQMLKQASLKLFKQRNLKLKSSSQSLKTTKRRKNSKTSTSSNASISRSSSAYSIHSDIKNKTSAHTNTESKPCAATSSSGYGTSVKSASAMSVYVNLDNYFYDENFAKIKSKAQENAKMMNSNVIQYFLDYQIEFLSILKSGLENHIRPLSALMKTELFFEIFQNIEKIYSMSEFIRNSINESLHLTQDIYTSTLTVIHEYISIIVETYEIYLKGYAQAIISLNETEFKKLTKVLKYSKCFDFVEFIDTPIKNLSKIYCAFMSLLEMTPVSESHDYERINSVCNHLKQLIGPSSNVSIVTNLQCASSEEIEIELNNQYEIEASSDEYSSTKHSDLSQITVTDLKYAMEKLVKKSSIELKAQSKLTNNKKLIKNKKTNLQSQFNKKSTKRVPRTTSPTLPNDFIDSDGKKYYFI